MHHGQTCPIIGPMTTYRKPIESPCKGVCAVNSVAGQCIGCYRTTTEIANWINYTEEERDTITAELEAREEAFWAQMDDSD